MNDFSTEIFFRTARSGGSGGQNVNKVETMAEACWYVAATQFFTEEEKERIIAKLNSKINKDGILSSQSTASRSQLENKEIAKKKLLALVANSLVVPKKRRPTRISKAAKEARLNSKKIASQKKEWRKPPTGDS